MMYSVDGGLSSTTISWFIANAARTWWQSWRMIYGCVPSDLPTTWIGDSALRFCLQLGLCSYFTLFRSPFVMQPSVLWQCWLFVRKSICLLKKLSERCWHSYLSGARCKWFACGQADATATAIICCFIKIQIGLTFLMLAYPGLSWKRGRWTFVLSSIDDLSLCLMLHKICTHVHVKTCVVSILAIPGELNWNEDYN